MPATTDIARAVARPFGSIKKGTPRTHELTRQTLAEMLDGFQRPPRLTYGSGNISSHFGRHNSLISAAYAVLVEQKIQRTQAPYNRTYNRSNRKAGGRWQTIKLLWR
jgi:hypothetical protein